MVGSFVTAKDYTFSKQIRGKPVPFGEAGDCYSYSKSGCPQGRFSIDLTGTGMRISQDTTWVGKGSNSSFWVNKIEVMMIKLGIIIMFIFIVTTIVLLISDLRPFSIISNEFLLVSALHYNLCTLHTRGYITSRISWILS